MEPSARTPRISEEMQVHSEICWEQLLDKLKEPFKSITKSVTDVSLAIIEGSLEDFRDIIKALPTQNGDLNARQT